MNTKEKVLEKCFVEWHRQDDPKVNGYSIHANSGGWYDIRSEGGSIHYKAYEGYPDDDPVWPLAAQVLGIKDDEYANLIKGCKEVIESATALYGHLPIYMLGIDAIVNPKPNEV